MNIESVMPNSASSALQQKPAENTPAEAMNSFKDVLNDAVSNVNKASLHSDEMTTKLATGETDNLHEVMVAAEKSSVMLQTTVEVRNKVIEAYQEIMRMQV